MIARRRCVTGTPPPALHSRPAHTLAPPTLHNRAVLRKSRRQLGQAVLIEFAPDLLHTAARALLSPHAHWFL